MMDFFDAMAALNDMLAEAVSSGDSPLAIAIVNEDGDLMSYVRMDEAPPYAEKESVELAQMARKYGVDLQGRATDLDVALLAELPRPSAVVVRESGVVIGAIGVSGGLTSRNELIARRGLSAFAKASAMRTNQ
ncbi:MAG TPA: heme-binding protein [Dehalococcoidia bacterium]|nr:heme-binding protein [Dehalococcoidia bacterium]